MRKQPFTSFVSVILAVAIYVAPQGFVNAQLRSISSNEISNPTSTVACFFDSWSLLQYGMKKFDVDFIDTNLCTHVVFCFAGLHERTLTIKHSPIAIDSEAIYEDLVAMKRRAPFLSVTVAVGGWTEGSDRFTRMVASAARRKDFLDSVLVYLRRYSLDGLDIVWQSPADRGGAPEDKDNLVKLCQELKEALKPRGYRFTIGIMSSKWVIDNGYDLAGIAPHVDAVYLMAYDYHGKWERKTGLNAPLYRRSDETGDELTKNVNFTVSYLIQKGVPPHKLVLGLPMFGRAYFLADANNHHLGASSLDGEFSSGDGLFAYNEICEKFVSEGIGWSLVRHPEHRVPYAFRGQSWIGYDDTVSLTDKVNFARTHGLGGVFAFALSSDDFRGRCGLGKYPLLTAVNEAIKKGTNIERRPERPPVVACYLQGWSVYRPGRAKFTAHDIDTSLCTHVIFSFAGIHETNLTIVDLDPSYVINGAYRDLFRLKWKNPSLVTIVSVGGYDEGSMKFSRMVATPQSRKVFIESVLEFLRNTLLDGIDLTWKEPTYRGSPLVDRENFALLCQEMAAAFVEGGYHLSVSVSGRRETLMQGYDLSAIGKAADLVHVILYDFFGPWDGWTSHTAPLYSRASDDEVQRDHNMDSAIRYVLDAGVPVEKVVANIAFFSRTYTLQDPARSEYGAPSAGSGPSGPYTNAPGFMAYNEVCELLRNQPELWTTHYDREHQVNYMHSKRAWLGFDNTTTVEERVRLALLHGVNGIGVWAVDMDDFRGNCGSGPYPLLKAVNRVLRRPVASPEPALIPAINPRRRNVPMTEPERPPVVACYLQGWSVYRPGRARFTAHDVNTTLCTHIIFSFAGIHDTNLTIVDLDPGYVINGAYRDLFRLKEKNPSLVTTVAVGGYEEGSTKFSRMVATPQSRKVFIESVLEFLRKTLLDGIDLAWHDPTYRGSPLVDRDNFVLLCQEMAAAFAEGGYYLGVTVSGRRETLVQGYDLPAIGKAVDLVHVILYDFFGPWDGRTSHTAPLYPRASDGGVQRDYNMDSAIRYVLEAGVPAEKVVADIAFFSRTYTLQDPARSEYGAPSSGSGPSGPCTNAPGFMAYSEVCELLQNESEHWTTHYDREHQVNYMHSKRAWLGFDNTTTVEERVRLALRHGVHGIGVWAVDMDDFRGNCGSEPYPLLRAVNRMLRKPVASPEPALIPAQTPPPKTVPKKVGCSLAPAMDVTVDVIRCGRQDSGTCAVEGRVPPDTVVLAECWKSAYMVMRCNKNGIWRSTDKKDTTGMRVSELCQPYYLNAQVCGRRPRYEIREAGPLILTNFHKLQNRWPWVAEILQNNASVCTGTLINPVYVLTAAHCVSRSQESSTMPIERSRLGVKFDGIASRKVEKVRIHPEYQTGSSPRNDIALIQLEQPMVFHSKLYPTCVAHAELDPFKEAVAFNRNVASPASLKYEPEVLIASPDCIFAQATCPGRLQVTESQFCATTIDFESLDLTVGSSGGPFLQDLPAEDVTEAWTVTGIVSSSSATADCSVPLFTDVFPFRDWLKDSVAALMHERF